MNKTTQIAVLPLVTAILLGGAGFASAESIDASAEVRATTTRPALRPLQLLRDEAKGVIKNMRIDIKDSREQMRDDIKNATSSEERRAIMNENRTENASARDDARAEVKADISERLSAIKLKISDRTKELFKTHVARASNRLDAVLGSLDKFVERIQSRITKLKGGGANTTSVEASLASSVSLIATAKADSAAIDAIIAATTDTSDPATVRADMKAAIEKASASVKAAHQALMNTVKDLVALTRASGQATTTAEVNN